MTDIPEDAPREIMVAAVIENIGPVVGTPEYLARPGNRERLEQRRQSAAASHVDAALSALRAAGYEVRPRDVIARVENLLRLICDNAVNEETSTHVVVSWDDGIASLIFNDAQRLRKMLAPPAPSE